MATQRFVWEAQFDTRTATAAVNQLKQLIQSSFTGAKVNIIDPASLAAAQNATRAAAAQFIEEERRKTVATRTEGAQRVLSDKAGLAQMQQGYKVTAATFIEEERRKTAEFRSQLRQREAEQRAAKKPASSGSGDTGNLLGVTVGEALTGFATVEGLRRIADGAVALADLGTQADRAFKSFQTLSGGAEQAASRINAIQNASGGTVNSLQAVTIANQAISLGLAKTSAEFGRLTQAARAVTFVSPVIKDVQSAITELALASANTSYRRLDQLGLSVTEVKARMAELQSQNGSLEDSQAFLAASVDTLIAKYGKLLDSVEAQASGVEQLRTAWDNLKLAIAQGPVGDFTNDVAQGLADLINVLSGNAGAISSVARLNQAINDLNEQADGGFLNGWDEFTGTNAALRQQADDLAGLRDELDLLNDVQSKGVPGTAETAKQLDEQIGLAIKDQRVTAERAQAINSLSEQLKAAVASNSAYARAVAIVGEETVQTDEYTRNIVRQMQAYDQMLAAGTVSVTQYATAIGTLEQSLQAVADAQAKETALASREELKSNLLKDTQDNALSAATDVGSEKAMALLEQQKQEITEFFNSLGDDVDPTVLAFKVAELRGQLDQEMEALKESLTISDLPVGEGLESLATSYEQLNTATFDQIPGIVGLRDEIASLSDEIAAAGVVTTEQATRIEELAVMTDVATSSASAYTSMSAVLGEAFFANNEQAGALFSQMLLVESAYQTGAMGAEEHAGRLTVLIQALYDVALAAGVAKSDLDAAFGSAQQWQQYVGGKFGTSPAFAAGAQASQSYASIQQAMADQRARDESRRAAEEAARKAASAQKKAASAWEKQMREAERAAERAAREVQKNLEAIPGLFDISSVSADDIANTALGTYQNKPDEYLRRLRDEVLNGVQRDDVSIEEAAAGLRKIGQETIGLSNEAILKQFEAAWANSSLFADTSNIEAFVDQAAVQAQLDLQVKIKQGHDNLLAFFGGTVDKVNEAIDGINSEIGGVGGISAIDPATAGADKLALGGDGAQVPVAVRVVQAMLAEDFKPIDMPVNPVFALSSDTGTAWIAALKESMATSLDGAQLGFVFVESVIGQFDAETVDTAMRALGARKVEAVYDGWKERAGELDWVGAIDAAAMGGIVSEAATQAAATVADGVIGAMNNTPSNNSAAKPKKQ